MHTSDYIGGLVTSAKKMIMDQIYTEFCGKLSHYEKLDLREKLHEGIDNSIGKTLTKLVKQAEENKNIRYKYNVLVEWDTEDLYPDQINLVNSLSKFYHGEVDAPNTYEAKYKVVDELSEDTGFCIKSSQVQFMDTEDGSFILL